VLLSSGWKIKSNKKETNPDVKLKFLRWKRYFPPKRQVVSELHITVAFMFTASGNPTPSYDCGEMIKRMTMGQWFYSCIVGGTEGVALQ
jgi:hypothetical protein